MQRDQRQRSAVLLGEDEDAIGLRHAQRLDPQPDKVELLARRLHRSGRQCAPSLFDFDETVRDRHAHTHQRLAGCVCRAGKGLHFLQGRTLCHPAILDL